MSETEPVTSTPFRRIAPGGTSAALFLIGLLVLPRPAQCRCRSGPPGAKVPDGIRLRVTTEKASIRLGDHLAIHAELVNNSRTSITLRDWWLVEWNYWARVLDSSNQEVPLTDYGKKIRPPVISGSGTFVELAPGETDRAEEDVTKIYDLSSPGKYSVQVCRDLGDLGSIYSNKIEIQVTR